MFEKRQDQHALDAAPPARQGCFAQRPPCGRVLSRSAALAARVTKAQAMGPAAQRRERATKAYLAARERRHATACEARSARRREDRSREAGLSRPRNAGGFCCGPQAAPSACLAFAGPRPAREGDAGSCAAAGFRRCVPG